MGTIEVARVYDHESRADASAFLVERLWPRGVRKDELGGARWLKDVAPSTELRKWFGHDPERWEEFRRRYTSELDAKRAAWRPIDDAAAHGNVVLLYSARDRERNSAVVLRDYLLAGAHAH